MPDALEFPRVRRSVVPLMGAGHSVVGELVANRFPSFAAIVGALDELSKPAAGLGSVDSVGIGGRSFNVVDFPARKMRSCNFPVLSFPIGFENERAFACADQYPN